MVNFWHGCKLCEENVVGILWYGLVQIDTPKSAESGSKGSEDDDEVSSKRRARGSEVAAGRMSLATLVENFQSSCKRGRKSRKGLMW